MIECIKEYDYKQLKETVQKALEEYGGNVQVVFEKMDAIWEENKPAE